MIPAFPSKGEQLCSEKGSHILAHQLHSVLRPGDAIYLEGEMGTGKTTWVRGFLDAVKTESRFFGSPTFPLATHYLSADGSQEYIHVDFYRFQVEEELLESGIFELLDRQSSIFLLEWASRFPRVRELASPCSWDFKFEYLSGDFDRRKITWEWTGPK